MGVEDNQRKGNKDIQRKKKEYYVALNENLNEGLIVVLNEKYNYLNT